jgi:hypothetical protein
MDLILIHRLSELHNCNNPSHYWNPDFLLEHLMERLRHHETACLSGLSFLNEGRDNIAPYCQSLVTSQQSNSRRNIIRFIFLHIMTRKSATQSVLRWRRSTRASLCIIIRQRRKKDTRPERVVGI